MQRLIILLFFLLGSATASKSFQIFWDGRFMCSGFVLEKALVTAAHCVDSNHEVSVSFVEKDLSVSKERISVVIKFASFDGDLLDKAVLYAENLVLNDGYTRCKEAPKPTTLVYSLGSPSGKPSYMHGYTISIPQFAKLVGITYGASGSPVVDVVGQCVFGIVSRGIMPLGLGVWVPLPTKEELGNGFSNEPAQR